MGGKGSGTNPRHPKPEKRLLGTRERFVRRLSEAILDKKLTDRKRIAHYMRCSPSTYRARLVEYDLRDREKEERKIADTDNLAALVHNPDLSEADVLERQGYTPGNDTYGQLRDLCRERGIDFKPRSRLYKKQHSANP